MTLELVRSHSVNGWEVVPYNANGFKGSEGLSRLFYAHLERFQDHHLEGMVRRVEKGEQRFDNLSYDVTVLNPPDIFFAKCDASGNQTWYARLFLLGSLTDFGRNNPEPWDKHPSESIIFAEIVNNPWFPEQPSVHLIHMGREYEKLELQYDASQQDTDMQERITTIWGRVNALRERRGKDEEQRRQVQTPMEEAA